MHRDVKFLLTDIKHWNCRFFGNFVIDLDFSIIRNLLSIYIFSKPSNSALVGSGADELLGGYARRFIKMLNTNFPIL